MTDTMRLLLTTDIIGGVWTYAIELAKALARHDVRIALATMGAPLSDQQRSQAAALDHVTVFESQYELEWMENPWDDVAAAGRWLLEIERDFHPDVVHLNGYVHGALPWRAPVLIVAHSCVCSWWEAVKGEAAPAEWNHYRRAVRDGLQSVARIVAPSWAMLECIKRHYGPIPPSRVIANGRDASVFGPAAKEPFIFSAGRLWDEAKNVGALDRIAPDVAWPIYAAGEEDERKKNSNLRRLGRLQPSAVADWLSHAAIYAMPARYEPFGLSILEAALSGCALVLGNIQSLREIWFGAATFVPPDDTQALREAVDHLIANPDVRQEMARAATLRARRFTATRMAAAYADLYRRMLAPQFVVNHPDGTSRYQALAAAAARQA